MFGGSGDIAPGDELFLTPQHNPSEHRSTRGATGDYNQVWLDDGLAFDDRTSQVVDPADGRLPPLTPEGARNQALAARARAHATGGPENRAPQERCLTFGTARVGSLMARNNSFHQIVQTAHSIVISSEMIYEARIIPLNGQPHPPAHIQFLDGDSRAHWEGTALVIDTTNFSSHPTCRQKGGPGGVG